MLNLHILKLAFVNQNKIQFIEAIYFKSIEKKVMFIEIATERTWLTTWEFLNGI